MDLAALIGALQSQPVDLVQFLPTILNYQATNNLNFASPATAAAPAAAANDSTFEKLFGISATSTPRIGGGTTPTTHVSARLVSSPQSQRSVAGKSTNEVRSRTKKATAAATPVTTTAAATAAAAAAAVPAAATSTTTRKDGKMKTTYSCPHCNFKTLMSQHMKSHLVSGALLRASIRSSNARSCLV